MPKSMPVINIPIIAAMPSATPTGIAMQSSMSRDANMENKTTPMIISPLFLNGGLQLYQKRNRQLKPES